MMYPQRGTHCRRKKRRRQILLGILSTAFAPLAAFQGAANHRLRHSHTQLHLSSSVIPSVTTSLLAPANDFWGNQIGVLSVAQQVELQELQDWMAEDWTWLEIETISQTLVDSEAIWEELLPFCRLVVTETQQHPALQRVSFVVASLMHFVECSRQYHRQRVVGPQKSSHPVLVDEPCLSTTKTGIPTRRGLASPANPVPDSNAAPLVLAHTQNKENMARTVQRLVRDAARLERAERLARRFLKTPTAQTSHDLRNFYISLSDDWRALAIRCMVSLYRLELILEKSQKDEPAVTPVVVVVNPDDEENKQVDSTTKPENKKSKIGDTSVKATVDFDSGQPSLQHGRYAPEAIQVAREALRIYAGLAQRLGLSRLKSRLQERAFVILHPRQYRVVSTLYENQGANLETVSKFLAARLEQILLHDDIISSQVQDLQVTSRVKEPFSFWKKLVKKRFLRASSAVERKDSDDSNSDLAVSQIKDGVALRVILKAHAGGKGSAMSNWSTQQELEILLCYYVQSLIQHHFPPTQHSTSKDYLRTPKPNGYQSLHYTSSISLHGEEIPFEVQIRSEEMHRMAEYGVAAHWDYKSSNGVSSGVTQSLLPPSSETSSYIDALAISRQHMVQQELYVFGAGSSQDGKLLRLPAGARVKDVLDAMVQNHATDDHTFLLNGLPVGLEDLVNNGDVLWVEETSQSLSRLKTANCTN